MCRPCGMRPMNVAEVLETKNELHIHLAPTNNLGFFINGSGSVSFSAPQEVNDNRWRHIVAIWDISGEASIYIDAQLAADATHGANEFLFLVRICELEQLAMILQGISMALSTTCASTTARCRRMTWRCSTAPSPARSPATPITKPFCGSTTTKASCNIATAPIGSASAKTPATPWSRAAPISVTSVTMEVSLLGQLQMTVFRGCMLPRQICPALTPSTTERTTTSILHLAIATLVRQTQNAVLANLIPILSSQ